MHGTRATGELRVEPTANRPVDDCGWWGLDQAHETPLVDLTPEPAANSTARLIETCPSGIGSGLSEFD